MKKIVYILGVLMLVLAFSSCQKIETEGFLEAEAALKKSTDQSTIISEEDKDRPSAIYRNEQGGDHSGDGDNITDDDDDEDDDENNPSQSK